MRTVAQRLSDWEATKAALELVAPRRAANTTKRRAVALDLLADLRGTTPLTAAQRLTKIQELVLRLALEEELEE